MKASEYVARLQALIKEHGDLECVDASDEQIPTPEEVDGAFVLADRA